MYDVLAQQKFANGCNRAAAGYMTAATAAYTGLAAEALDFWCTALSGLDSSAHKQVPVDRHQEPAFGMATADWSPFSWLEPRRYDSIFSIDTQTPPALAMMAFANVVPLRGSSASWPFAQVMIDSGVPRSVAWPAAEANAAALEAADVASSRLREIVASYHSESGFAPVVRSATPSLTGVMAAFGISLTPQLAAWA